jgi:hypothetical protein
MAHRPIAFNRVRYNRQVYAAKAAVQLRPVFYGRNTRMVAGGYLVAVQKGDVRLSAKLLWGLR